MNNPEPWVRGRVDAGTRRGPRVGSALFGGVILSAMATAAQSQADGDIGSLAGALQDAPAPERAALLSQLSVHGDAAVDVILRLMQEGELARAVALSAVAELQSGAVDPPGEGQAAGAAGEAPLPPAAGQPGDGAPPSGSAHPQTQAEAASMFTHVPGYAPQDEQAATTRLIDSLAGDPASVFLPGQWLGPMTQAVLLLENEAGVLPHVRYRLTYGMELLPKPPAADPVPVSFVQVDRFNLGPAMHAEIERAAAGAPVAPIEHFGTGPHLSYRMVTRPIQGRSADIIGLSRAELPQAQAESAVCHGQSCLSIAPVAETLDTGLDRLEEHAPPPPDAPYAWLRDGAHSPAAVVDLVTLRAGIAQERGGEIAWTGFERREGLDPMESLAELVVESALGQDMVVDAILHEQNVMDHAISAVWQRVVSMAGGAPDAPLLLAAEVFVHRPGQH